MIAEPFIVTIHKTHISVGYVLNIPDKSNLSLTIGNFMKDTFSAAFDNLNFPNAKLVILPSYLDCGNFLDAKERIIPFLTITDDVLGSCSRLYFVKAGYDGALVKTEVVWEKEIGRQIGSEITVVKFEASRTHTYIAYEVYPTCHRNTSNLCFRRIIFGTPK